MGVATGATSTSTCVRDTLLERDRELRELDLLVGRALGGEPMLAVVEGPAGIGKSRLLAAAREKASDAGSRVLSARGSDLERELPFGIVRQLFEPVLSDPDQRRRWLSGPALPAARAFAPPDDGDVVGDVSFGILYGLFWLTANIAADGPLALIVDDLHWCDTASVRFITYLEPRLRGLRVFVATATRIGQPDAESRLIGEIAHAPTAVSIRPDALSAQGVDALVRERLGRSAEPAFTAACRRATGGNPLLLHELLKTLRTEHVVPDAAHAHTIRDIGPRAVSHSVLLRLWRLPREAAAVARAVAVLGAGAGLPIIAALSELDDQRTAEATRVLIDAEILRAEPSLDFVHPLVRDSVYHELAPSERELLHERAVRTLLALGATPEQVAAHLLAVPRRADARVVTLLQEAARGAIRRGVTESAVSYLGRALQEPAPAAQRPELMLELGLAEALLNLPSAAEHIREARAHLDEPLGRARAAEVLARILVFSAPPQESVAVAQMAIGELPDEFADQRRALEAFELYAVAFGAEVPNAAARLAAVRGGELADGVGARMLAAVAAWDWALRGGTADACAELASAALADGTLVAADPGFMTIIAVGVLVLADRDGALASWEAAMAQAHRVGSVFAVGGVDLWRGWTWLQRGELAEAEDSVRRALEATMLVGDRHGAGMAYVSAFLSRTLLERGDLAGARAALATRGDPSPGSDGDTLVRRGEIELLLAEGQWTQALAEAEDYQAALQGVDNPAWGPWRSLTAIALDALGEHEPAFALLEQELVDARRWGAPGALSRTLRLLGTMRGDDGLEQLQEAVAVAEGSSARLELAKALTALGSALRRGRRPTDARDPLRRGLELAGRCGAQSLAEHARAELYAAGGRPRRAALAGPASLTPSERRIAELAAAGRSNREIAQMLYVTPKTVEIHLTSVYRKLGISRRAALSGALT
jgi:DNA-binding CsgD family transcriptional regulator